MGGEIFCADEDESPLSSQDGFEQPAHRPGADQSYRSGMQVLIDSPNPAQSFRDLLADELVGVQDCRRGQPSCRPTQSLDPVGGGRCLTMFVVHGEANRREQGHLAQVIQNRSTGEEHEDTLPETQLVDPVCEFSYGFANHGAFRFPAVRVVEARKSR